MTELFIRRPIMTTLVMIAILLFGIVAYRSLPVSDLPNVDFPTIAVSAALPGASPETMASAVGNSVGTPIFYNRRTRFDELSELHRIHKHYFAV